MKIADESNLKITKRNFKKVVDKQTKMQYNNYRKEKQTLLTKS